MRGLMAVTATGNGTHYQVTMRRSDARYFSARGRHSNRRHNHPGTCATTRRVSPEFCTRPALRG